MFYQPGTNTAYVSTQTTWDTTGYSQCSCTWTVCQCSFYNRSNFTPIPLWDCAKPDFNLKRLNRERMESLQLKHRAVKAKIKLPKPPIRSQVQALSMRIK